MNTKITFGGDPELMLQDKEGAIVSAIPVLKNDKHTPIDLGGGMKMYADNVLLEFTFPPSGSALSAVSTVGRALRKAQEWLGDGHKLVSKASHVFTEAQLGPKPEVMKGKLPTEWEIGCNPSYSAYKPGENIPDPFKDGLRTGSCHIHLGSDMLLPPLQKLISIKIMDLIVGCSGVLVDNDETSLARRMLYGKAGEFRPTPYGVEWRVLSNYALRSPRLMRLIFDLSQYAMDVMAAREHLKLLESTDWSLVQTAINTNNKTLASMALRDLLPSKLGASVAALSKESFDMHQEWRLA